MGHLSQSLRNFLSTPVCTLFHFVLEILQPPLDGLYKAVYRPLFHDIYFILQLILFMTHLGVHMSLVEDKEKWSRRLFQALLIK